MKKMFKYKVSLLLVIAALCTGTGPWVRDGIVAVDICSINLWITYRLTKVIFVGTPPYRYVGAIVLPNHLAVSGVPELHQDGVPVPTDTTVSAAHQALLQAALSYNPATETIQYYRTTNPIAGLTGTETFRLGFHANALNPAVPMNGSEIAREAQTTDDDLDNGSPLTDVTVNQHRLCLQCVPAIGTLGLAVMAALVLGAGAIVVRKRRTEQSMSP